MRQRRAQSKKRPPVKPRGKRLPRVKFNTRVTGRHGEIFAAGWFPTSFQGEEVLGAFADTHLMQYPDGEAHDPRQNRYQEIEDEILERTFLAVRAAVAEAFVKAAREVLVRERRRDVLSRLRVVVTPSVTRIK
jgi:hypothetical protein